MEGDFTLMSSFTVILTRNKNVRYHRTYFDVEKSRDLAVSLSFDAAKIVIFGFFAYSIDLRVTLSMTSHEIID